jgi:hypothetical protein
MGQPPPIAVDPRSSEIQSRIARLASDCGCAMGGVFSTVTLVAVTVYFLGIGPLDWSSGMSAIALVFVSSLLGKLFGLLVARIRILWLRRLLETRRESVEVSHVHMH